MRNMEALKAEAIGLKIKNELFGATAAAIISIPMAIGYGVTVFTPLGTSFIAQAALIGLNAAIIGGFFSSLFGGAPGQISGPQASLTMILATAVLHIYSDYSLPQEISDINLIVVFLVSFCVLIGGLTQVLLGIFKMGNLIKYIPHPVLAGFLNGIAILLIWKQIPIILGIDRNVNVLEVLSNFSLVDFGSFVIGLSALCAVFISKMFLKRMPSILFGLLSGALVYVILYLLTDYTQHVAVIGQLSPTVPSLSVFTEIFNNLSRNFHLEVFYDLCGYGLMLGMLGSMESLMSSTALENLSEINVDSNKELIGQGIGNIIASLFGSISSAGSIIRSHANIKAGGKSRLSGAICSVIMFLCIWTIAPLIGKIPLSIFAGVISSVGFTLFDLSILRLVRFYRPFSEIQKDIFISLIVHVCVIVITVTVSLTSAVLIGTLLSTAYFILKMGMTSIRRQYSGSDITSKKIRQSTQYSCLKNNGKEIQIFELQGPIFFGSADKLTRLIESRTHDATFCILDMNHVSEIDSTGAIILIRLYKRFIKSGKYLLITHIHNGRSIKDFMTVTGVLSEFNEQHVFIDTDGALEWAEDRIISELCYIDDRKRYKLGELEVLQNFSDDELEIFKQFLDLKTFKKGEAIINEGQNDRDLLMLTHGLVSITLHLQNSDRKNRLFTFSSGATIGEMALLDGNPRSADVWADDDSEFYRLTFNGYRKICDDHPHIALKLVTNIGSIISHRLRIRSQELRMLADK